MSQSPDPSAAVERVAELTPDAADLLCLCAFLDPAHPLPVAALDAGADALPARLAAALRDPAARERTFDALLDAGAGGLAADELVLLPAAAEAGRGRLDEDARRGWAAAAAGVMERVFPADPTRQEGREAAGRLLPHAVAAARHALETGAAPAAAAQLLYLAGRYLLEARGDFPAARELLKRAVAARERAHGARDTRVALDLNYLNGALLHLGEWGEMAANATRAAAILEAELGPRDRTAITHVNNAALLLARAGHRGRAREWFTRALELAEPVFGKAHPFCATILNNLGDLDRGEGNLHAARDLYRRALAIDEGAYGPRHNSVARDLGKLGEVLAVTGDHAAARAPLSRALAWFIETDGPDDVRVAHLRSLLARLKDSPPRPPPV
jgi:tetratricopeptide (TPR) repeat protein